MKDRIIIIVFSICASGLVVKAQDSLCCGIPTDVTSYSPQLIGRMFIDRHIDKPEQYYGYWQRGDVYLTNGEVVKNQYLRYNGLLDELLWMRENDFQSAILDRRFISKFVIHDEKTNSDWVFFKLNEKNIQHPEFDNIYMQLLADGKMSLYKNYQVEENSVSADITDHDYYYIDYNGDFSRIAANRWSLYKLAGEQKKMMKHVIRSHHLTVREENNLKQAVELFNEEVGK